VREGQGGRLGGKEGQGGWEGEWEGMGGWEGEWEGMGGWEGEWQGKGGRKGKGGREGKRGREGKGGREGRREGKGEREGGREGVWCDGGGDSGGYSPGVLKSTLNDECRSSFGRSHMWVVVFVCRCSLSYMGVSFPYVGSHFCMRVCRFVCRCGQLSSNVGGCLHTQVVVFICGWLPLGHMMVVVCGGSVGRRSLSSWD
jgi:hypothetical protein